MATSGSPAKPIAPRELLTYRGSFALLILAEAMVFVTVFALRFVLVGNTPGAALSLWLGIALTAIFLVSAFPAFQALRAIRDGRQEAMVRYLGIALVLGLLALVIIVLDWATLDIPFSDPFGSAYLLATLYHVIHIVAGLVTFLALRSSGRRGRFSPANHWVVEAGVLLWMFVIVTWLALFVVFYLL